MHICSLQQRCYHVLLEFPRGDSHVLTDTSSPQSCRCQPQFPPSPSPPDPHLGWVLLYPLGTTVSCFSQGWWEAAKLTMFYWTVGIAGHLRGGSPRSRAWGKDLGAGDLFGRCSRNIEWKNERVRQKRKKRKSEDELFRSPTWAAGTGSTRAPEKHRGCLQCRPLEGQMAAPKAQWVRGPLTLLHF